MDLIQTPKSIGQLIGMTTATAISKETNKDK